MNHQVFIDGREIPLIEPEAADLREVEPGVFSVLRNGRAYEVRIVPSQDGYSIQIGGTVFKAEVRDPRSLNHRRASGLGHGRQNITSPMPGKVVRVLVHAGQEVEPGQGLLVVEAMKMQNEMKASKAGRVAAINVKDGDTVAAGETLTVIE